MKPAAVVGAKTEGSASIFKQEYAEAVQLDIVL